MPGTSDQQLSFMRDYLVALIRAINEGCDVRGYMWWTLISNFEWHLGFSSSFGLWSFNHETNVITRGVGVDYFKHAFGGP